MEKLHLNESDSVTLIHITDDEKHQEKIFKQFAPYKQKLDEKKIQNVLIIEVGDPKEKLSNYINDRHIELCVMGHRGMNKLKSVVMGSVSEYLLKHTTCKILLSH